MKTLIISSLAALLLSTGTGYAKDINQPVAQDNTYSGKSYTGPKWYRLSYRNRTSDPRQSDISTQKYTRLVFVGPKSRILRGNLHKNRIIATENLAGSVSGYKQRSFAGPKWRYHRPGSRKRHTDTNLAKID